MSKRIRCEDCGEWYGIGQWYSCPHEPVDEYRPFKKGWDVDLDEKPIYVESHRHRRKLMKERNLDYLGRKVGMPGCEV